MLRLYYYIKYWYKRDKLPTPIGPIVNFAASGYTIHHAQVQLGVYNITKLG